MREGGVEGRGAKWHARAEGYSHIMTSRTALTIDSTFDLTLFGSGPASKSDVPHPSAQGSRFRVQGSGFRVQGLVFGV